MRAKHPVADRRTYLGYRDADHHTPFAKWFDPEMAPLAPHVVQAVTAGAQSPPLLPQLEDAPGMLDGDEPTEDGFSVNPDGSIAICDATIPMPTMTSFRLR